MRSLLLRYREEEGMKKFLALLAVLGIVSGGVLGVGAIVACAAGDPPTVTGEVAGFATGADFLWESQADQQRDLDLMAATGAKWLRLDFPWPSLQPSPATFNWGPFDRIVTMARAKGLDIIGLPSYTPDWAKLPGAPGTNTPNPVAYATFVTALVSRYRPQGITTWEIWNEPNQAWSWSPPDPAAYTRLLIPAALAVRAVDPTATVLTAGLAPASDRPGEEVAPATFVRGIYANGGKGSFDAVGMHPYSFPALPTDTSTASWNTFQRLPEIHQIMDDNGDGAKKIWLTEYGAPTGSGEGAVSEARQADFVREGFVARAKYPWAGPLIWYSARDTGTDAGNRDQNCGLWRHDFSAKASAGVFNDTIQGDVGIHTAFTVSR